MPKKKWVTKEGISDRKKKDFEDCIRKQAEKKARKEQIDSLKKEEEEKEEK